MNFKKIHPHKFALVESLRKVRINAPADATECFIGSHQTLIKIFGIKTKFEMQLKICLHGNEMYYSKSFFISTIKLLNTICLIFRI